MFDKMKDMMGQFQMMQRLMKDENFKAFITHPKVQELLKDEVFQELIKRQDFEKIITHSRFAELMKDPELASLMSKIDPKSLMNA